MKKIWNRAVWALLISAVLLTGCKAWAGTDEGNSGGTALNGSQHSGPDHSGTAGNEGIGGEAAGTDSRLAVRFGDSGEPFLMHLYENDTAAAIAGYVGTSEWRLPIYHYDESEVMEYYDIPRRYEIPSDPETVTSVNAGDAYYSDPNRIVLFYRDAEITGEYTKIGYFDATEEFVSAVVNNPVLEGWGNQIVIISREE